jgi:hypothetical protein
MVDVGEPMQIACGDARIRREEAQVARALAERAVEGD